MTEQHSAYELKQKRIATCNRLARASEFWNNLAYGSAGSAATLLVFSQAPVAKLGAVLLAGTAAICYGLHALRDSQHNRAQLPADQFEIKQPITSAAQSPVQELSLQEQFERLSVRRTEAVDPFIRGGMWAVGSAAFSMAQVASIIPSPEFLKLPIALTTLAISANCLFRGFQLAWAMQKIANFKRDTGFNPDASAPSKMQPANPS